MAILSLVIIALLFFPSELFPFGGIGEEQHASRKIEQCSRFELVQEHRLGPGRIRFGHVQGLEVTDEFFLVTSIGENRESGFLYIYLRSGEERRIPLREYDLWKLAQDRAPSCGSLGDGPLNHPSGVHLVENRLHVAIGPSANRGPSCIMTLDFHDISAPEVVTAIRLEEHIGALVELPGGALIGFNWASNDYWRIEANGQARRFPLREVRHSRVEELLHLQDCDRVSDLVYCGHSNKEDNLLKIYQAGDFGRGEITLRPRIILIPPFGSQNGGTHEGVAWYQGHLFLLPDDGDEAGVSIYELECKGTHSN